MGLFDFVKDIPFIGTAVDLGTDWLKNEFINKPNAEAANKTAKEASALAWERSYGAYKSRYQDSMADMKQAGLNPILAAGGISGSPPQASSAQSFQAAQPSSSGTQAGVNIEKRKEIIKNRKLLVKKALTEIRKAAQSRAQQGLITAQEKMALKNVQKIVEETELLLQKQMGTSAQTSLTEQQERYLMTRHKALKMTLKELEKTSLIYGAPAGHILKFFELLIKSLTPKIISMGGSN